MISKPKISVIMSVYNGERYLKEAIESILRQTFTDFEFIIVDDGSTDNSLYIIKGYDDDRIKVIKNDFNVGLTKSLNKALIIAKGEYVARQDADDVSLSCRFEEQIKFYENNPELALLGTSVYIIDKKGRIIEEKTAISKPVKYLLNDNLFAHGSVMFNRLIVNKLGGYNELFKYSQDYELWLRITKYHKAMKLQLPLYCLRLHRKTITSTKRIDQFLYKILAKKIMMNKVKYDNLLIESIEKHGIRSIYNHLNEREKRSLNKIYYRSIFGINLYQSGVGRALLKVYHILCSEHAQKVLKY